MDESHRSSVPAVVNNFIIIGGGWEIHSEIIWKEWKMMSMVWSFTLKFTNSGRLTKWRTETRVRERLVLTSECGSVVGTEWEKVIHWRNSR